MTKDEFEALVAANRAAEKTAGPWGHYQCGRLGHDGRSVVKIEARSDGTYRAALDFGRLAGTASIVDIRSRDQLRQMADALLIAAGFILVGGGDE